MRLKVAVFLMMVTLATVLLALPLSARACVLYYLHVDTDPRGLSPRPTPPSGWHLECTWVCLEAPAVAWYNTTALDRMYTFYYWKVDGRRFGENIITIHMDANHTAIAVYVRGPIDPVGDVNYDGHVDLRDLIILARHFGLHSRGSKFYPECDLNKDGRIDIIDLSIAAKHFEK